jgi:hypothetical protein
MTSYFRLKNLSIEKIFFNYKNKTMTTNPSNKTTFEPKKIQEQRFEFILYINNKIICQRYFDIRDFNEESISSLEMKNLMDSICSMSMGSYGEMGIIPKHLKNKAIDYLWSYHNMYSSNQDQIPRNIFERIDNFQFEIKIDKKMVGKSMFSGNFFPPKVRYAVDIKEIIPLIMGEIRYFLSQKKYTKVLA